MRYTFLKYHGSGNDFVLVDDQDESFPVSEVKRICNRRYGVGADGVILARSPREMVIYNADGSQAEMCGNGLRCFVRYLIEEGESETEFVVSVGEKNYPISIDGDEIIIDMGLPTILEAGNVLEGMKYYHIDSGVPHFIHFCDPQKIKNFEDRAQTIRFHPHFSPLGVNVSFATISSSNHLLARTYERGVEAETFSCGTGATAICIAAWKEYGMTGTMDVEFCSGEVLHFDLIASDLTLHGIYMRGKAKRVFQGDIECKSQFQKNSKITSTELDRPQPLSLHLLNQTMK